MPGGWKFWPDKEPGPVDDAYVQLQWIRPYRPGPVRVGWALVIAAGSAYLLFAGYLASLQQSTRTGQLLGFGLTIVLAGPLLFLALRVLTGGLWVNDAGVRILRLLRSEQIGWEQVVDVRQVPAPARLLGTPLRVAGSTVFLVLVDGSDRETPVTDRGPDFIGRVEAYDMAAGAVERWFEAAHRDN